MHRKIISIRVTYFVRWCIHRSQQAPASSQPLTTRSPWWYRCDRPQRKPRIHPASRKNTKLDETTRRVRSRHEEHQRVSRTCNIIRYTTPTSTWGNRAFAECPHRAKTLSLSKLTRLQSMFVCVACISCCVGNSVSQWFMVQARA